MNIRWKVNGAQVRIPDFQVPIVKRIFDIEVLGDKQGVPADSATAGKNASNNNKGGK